LALMVATQANLEPIYLVYDGGGAASELVAGVTADRTIADAVTADGVTHRLWALTDPAAHAAIAADLGQRRALIADGHHRYATYRQLQSDCDGQPGPWDRGLALLVDTTSYGPQVHAIHRVVARPFEELTQKCGTVGQLSEAMDLSAAIAELERATTFTMVLSNGDDAVVFTALSDSVRRQALGAEADSGLGQLDVTLLHRVLVEHVWQLADDEATVSYAHDVEEAIQAADSGHTAVLLRPTPAAAVAAVAAAGARLPRKSTLFTPKPASGMVIRRFSDQ
jgi:uncharacterized protein (DUF1015 family)